MDLIEQGVYKSGMLRAPGDARGLTVRRFEAPDIPAEVLQAKSARLCGALPRPSDEEILGAEQ